MIIEFLTELYQGGLGYSALCSAKAAVLNFLSLSVGLSFDKDADLFQKFMKGIFNLRPALPKNSTTWDTSVVLNYLKSQSPPDALSLLALSRKLVTLLLLLSGQRGQAIHSLDITTTSCTKDMLILRFDKLLKTSKPGSHLDEIVLPAYTSEPGLCVVQTYLAYVRRTKRFRSKQGQLLISTVKPHGPVSKDTVGKWVKATLQVAGIDLALYGVHSTRAAATSKAWMKGLPLQSIIKTAGWCSDNTFRKFYKKPITRSGDFANTLLN